MIRWHIFNRKVHYWGSLLIAAPILVVIVTGILLQLKKDLDWVQPPEQRGSTKVPTLSPDRILAICQTLPELEIGTWADIHRIDIRPSKGILKVTARNRWEAQIDHASGSVLQVAYRRSDLIESLHDGSWFHDRAKLWLFLPAALGLLILWLTGMYLFVLPLWVKRRRNSGKNAGSRNPGSNNSSKK